VGGKFCRQHVYRDSGGRAPCHRLTGKEGQQVRSCGLKKELHMLCLACGAL
jgi:hypothetical protein